MMRRKRGWLSWSLVALFGCSSSQPAASTSVSPDSGGPSTGAGGSSLVPGPEGGMDATPVQDGDSGACVDRSAPACQPKVIGPAGDAGDAGRGLTVIGKNAYWTRVSKPLALLRTSLDDDQTTDLPIPPSVPEDFAFFEARYLVNDGTNVFAASTYCCAGPENALFGYYVSDGSWKSTDLANSLGVSGFLYASGS